MLRLLKSYSLLVCTWLLIAGLIVSLWLIHGLNPPIALLILLVIVALIPLAERLKIGDWFDFTKKVDNLSKEVSSTKTEVREIRNVVMSNIQRQQQFNVSLANEKTAQAFAAEFVVREPELQHQPSGIQKEGLVGKDTFFSDKMSSADRQRFFFIDAADQLITRATSLMQILYYASLAKQEQKRPEAKQVLRKDMIPLLEELQRDWDDMYALDAGDTSTCQQNLEYIKTLIKLREDVNEANVEPPPVGEGKKILKDARRAIGYFHGFITMGYAIQFAPRIVLESIEKPSGSRD